MKRLFTTRWLLVGVLFCFFGQGARAGALKNWVNTSGGSWFDPNNWSPNSVPTNGDAVTITNNGTYTILAPTGTVTCTTFTIGGASGKQTFVYGSLTGGQLFFTNSTVQNNGVLVLTNGGATGSLLVQSGGELQFNSISGLQLYTLSLTNLGTITWSNGSLAVGGNNSSITYITNAGLWQILGDLSVGSGGGGPSVVVNAGTIKKFTGSGALVFGMNISNLLSGVVDCASGTFRLAPISTNFLSSSFIAESGTTMLYTGNESDSGAVLSGAGSHQFTFGNFYFRTNPIPNLKLVSGDLFILGTTTFQNAGAITNLTIDGSVLHGNNRISGTLTLNSGNVVDQMTVLPSGQLNLTAGAFGTQFYGLTLFNQGTVNWTSGSIAVGGTVISNGGTWNITGDYPMNNGGGAATLTNYGTIQKTSGTGVSTVQGVNFINQPAGIVRVATGTLQMPVNYTNLAGEMQLAGGTFTSSFGGSNYMTGGTLDGSGSVSSAASFDGGTVVPGPGSAQMQFKSGLTLGTNCILSLDGTGTTPGVSYDQISVTGGTLGISNATLQVTSLPSVPVGTTFVIITNATITPTMGTFNGLPENAPLTISGQPFRIHYSGGDGNDVVLVRDSGGAVVGPQLSSGGYTNKTFKLLGVGGGSTIYTIQASTNFLQWTNVGMATGDISGNFLFTDTNATNFRYRFYRTTN